MNFLFCNGNKQPTHQFAQYQLSILYLFQQSILTLFQNFSMGLTILGQADNKNNRQVDLSFLITIFMDLYQSLVDLALVMG
jgi:hypothetical protein